MRSVVGLVTFCINLVVFGSAQSPITPEDYTHNAVLDNADNVHLYWKYNSTYITFEIIGRTNGWVGFGISPNGGMANSDMYVGWVKNGTANITDRHRNESNGFPSLDLEQNVELLDGRESDGWTNIKFERQFAACEENDRPITTDTLKIIWALGDTDPEGDDIVPADYHGSTTRGSRSLLLRDGPVPIEPSTNETTSSFEILMDKFTVPRMETYYNCKMIEMPTFSKKHHIVKVEPVIEPGNEAYVHHILLYQCNYQIIQNASLINESHQCYSNMPLDFNGCTNIFFAWAIGGQTFYYPKNVGLPLGTDDSAKYVIMETHYDNPESRRDIVDNSGLRIYYTDQLRQYDAGVIQVGHTVLSALQLIPPKAESFLQYGECHRDCLNAGMAYINRTEIKIFANVLHSHLLGRKLTLRHISGNGTELPYIAKDDYYDFNYQEARVFGQEISLHANDTLQMVCSYNSEDRNNITLGGLGTQEEMCLSYVFYYPRMPVTKCESFPTNPYEYFGVNNYNFTVPPSTYMDLEDVIALAPEDFANKTIGSIVQNITWNEDMADNFSYYLKTGPLFSVCESYAFNYFGGFVLPVDIKEEYTEPELKCLKSSSSSQIKFSLYLCALVLFVQILF